MTRQGRLEEIESLTREDAAFRHEATMYDELLARGMDREDAIREAARVVLEEAEWCWKRELALRRRERLRLRKKLSTLPPDEAEACERRERERKQRIDEQFRRDLERYCQRRRHKKKEIL